ncbi:hypothetical protein L2E82_06376 [Cichorium intybus]|uniref:Uncharacterized protein n=1 Tax=Cichorium intybus TaxID=13427 RepID=A0ACB9HAY9_CICIN|nr:hypothetical protein L2E82_06376 [Cichorium intybus]
MASSLHYGAQHLALTTNGIGFNGSKWILSIVYDGELRACHYTEDMRDDALEAEDLNSRDAIVVDVGGGTGFTTLGIVKHVDAKNMTILDQSPHQMM